MYVGFRRTTWGLWVLVGMIMLVNRDVSTWWTWVLWLAALSLILPWRQFEIGKFFSNVEPATMKQLHFITELGADVGVTSDQAMLAALGYRAEELSYEEAGKVLDWLSERQEGHELEGRQ